MDVFGLLAWVLAIWGVFLLIGGRFFILWLGTPIDSDPIWIRVAGLAFIVTAFLANWDLLAGVFGLVVSIGLTVYSLVFRMAEELKPAPGRRKPKRKKIYR